jgi:hypothetical protein
MMEQGISLPLGAISPLTTGRAQIGTSPEGAPFFLAAVFVGIYLYDWTRLPALS